MRPVLAERERMDQLCCGADQPLDDNLNIEPQTSLRSSKFSLTGNLSLKIELTQITVSYIVYIIQEYSRC